MTLVRKGKKNAESFLQPRRSFVQPCRIQLPREADQIMELVQPGFSASLVGRESPEFGDRGPDRSHLADAFWLLILTASRKAGDRIMSV